jgi:hypothetical protein
VTHIRRINRQYIIYCVLVEIDDRDKKAQNRMTVIDKEGENQQKQGIFSRAGGSIKNQWRPERKHMNMKEAGE